MRFDRSSVRLACTALLIVAGACSDDTFAPRANPLAGLAAATRGDTAAAPSDSTPSGPGHFVGALYGYEPGPDTAASAVPIAGARVTAFVREEASGQVVAGDEVASVLTNAQGFFQLPTLPGGQYVVTFVPPASSPFRGGWTTAHAWPRSGDGEWYIMLPRK